MCWQLRHLCVVQLAVLTNNMGILCNCRRPEKKKKFILLVYLFRVLHFLAFQLILFAIGVTASSFPLF